MSLKFRVKEINAAAFQIFLLHSQSQLKTFITPKVGFVKYKLFFKVWTLFNVEVMWAVDATVYWKCVLNVGVIYFASNRKENYLDKG